MVVFASAFAVLLLGTLAVIGRSTVDVLTGSYKALRQISEVLEGMADPAGEDFRIRLDALSRTVEELPRIWETQKRQADNAEARARYHAKHALDALEEHGFSATPGLEAVNGDLFEADGERVGPVLAMPSGVEAVPADDDWEVQVRRKKYGG